jgi:[acyl-carrier-protein] S-malonyltransferase
MACVTASLGATPSRATESLRNSLRTGALDGHGMNVVYMFPGQSSRYPGMLPKLTQMSAESRQLVELGSELLHRDLGAHYREDNADAYGCNLDVQLGVFLANHLFLRLLESAGVTAVGSLGLSLGEWNHLVHIGAVSFGDALLAVAERGAAYDAGPRGAMASVFPLALEELEPVVAGIQGLGVLEVVNLNSPRQQVISGDTAAVEEAVRVLEDELGVHAVMIERQVPMHSSLFEPVGARFRQALARVPFQRPRLPYLPNRLAELIAEPSTAQLVDLLSSHVHQPVLWARSIDLVVRTWPDLTLVEVGPKAVLFNLLDRKWHRGVRKLHTDSTKDTAAQLEQVLQQLRG